MDERTTESSSSENCPTPEVDRAARLAALGLMARGLAHDFANLLMVIAGHAELALERIGADDPLRNSLEQIQRAAQQADALCGELAAFAGRTPLPLVSTNLSDEARRIAGKLAQTLPDGVRVACDAAPDLPSVEVHRTKLEQLVGELLANAADALDGQPGTISLRTGRTMADRRALDAAVLGERLEPGEYVFLEVADPGSGMDTVTAARMFDPFFTTRRKGHGLGLPRVLGIVRAHGGAIYVATEPEHGTTVRVLFPPEKALSAASREALRKLLEG